MPGIGVWLAYSNKKINLSNKIYVVYLKVHDAAAMTERVVGLALHHAVEQRVVLVKV